MPETLHAGAAVFRRAWAPLVRRARVVACAWAVVAASATSALVGMGLVLAGQAPVIVRVAAVATLFVLAISGAIIWSRRWSFVRVAADLERRAGGFDNLIVTAAEAATGARRPLHPVVAEAVWAAASERLPSARSHAPAVGGAAVLAALSVAAALAVAWWVPGPLRVIPESSSAGLSRGAAPLAAGDLRVHVTPPAYAGHQATTTLNPDAITVLEGSLVRLDVAAADEGVQIVDPGRETIDLSRAGDVWTHAFIASTSRVLLLQPRTGVGATRLLQVRVDPDRSPVVRIQAPARDLVMPDATGQVPVEIAAEDDLALDHVRLRYTRVSGSGEAFTFEEGDAPLAIDRSSATAWRARAALSLAALKLEDGDTLVYRAVAGDRKPGRDPSVSDTFIVEIGRLAGVASTGFAVPRERDRHAISQQMVIIKTERLHAERATLARDAVAEQSRLLAVEQRMVRAEFVFMTGGHVEDEVAEAEAGHEIVEGRLENQAQVELLAAIREMSRAEARLNDGDTTQALVFERAALRALQRAFDRRRYLLRTLPERTRIDAARRLTGERREARGPSLEPVRPTPDPVVAAARAALVALTDPDRIGASPARLAARVVSVDPSNVELQQVAVALASAAEPELQRAATRDAQRVLASLIQSRMGAAPRLQVDGEPLTGRVADRLRRDQP